MGYALHIFLQVFRLYVPSTPFTNNKKSISVIICAKNEGVNLQRNLPLILAQRYTNEAGNALYEVIVADDASTDNTAEVLSAFQRQYSHLKIVTINADEKRVYPGKKHALSKAINTARNEYLVMTDADCVPASDQWLEMMAQPLNNGKEIVAGYGKYKMEDGFLNTFIRWETMHTFLQYAGYALSGKPYMAVGRNMACSKELFLKAQDTKEWGMLPSGDDDLLINACANADNIAIVATDEAFTESAAKQTWKDWLKQKQRHTSTGKYYKPGMKALLGMYATAHAMGWFAFLVLLFTAQWQLAVGVMLCRCIVYWAIWYKTILILKERKLAIWFPVMDIGWLVYNFVLSPYIFFKNKQQWT